MSTNHYQDRVNRVLDYVSEHLDGDLSLNRLARVSNFSPFHFHRLFHGVTGETLNSYVRRARLEKAAQLMRASPKRRITDIALDVGFGGSSEFSRAFKSHFGRSASSWDRRSALENSKICKVSDSLVLYPLDELESKRREAGLRVRVTKVDKCRFVYIRTFDPYKNERLIGVYHSLVDWLSARQTELGDVVIVGMSQDDPAITPSDKYRYDMGIAFAEGSKGGLLGEIMKYRKRPNPLVAIPKRSECESFGLTLRDFGVETIAAIHCVGDLSVVAYAWQYLFRIWLPKSGYQPANMPAFEVFARTPEEIGWTTFDLHACLPITKL